MILVVLDTNVLASGFLRSYSIPGRILAAWMRGAFALVVYVVTGDRELLRVRSYHGVAVVSPRDFLSVLESAGGGRASDEDSNDA